MASFKVDGRFLKRIALELVEFLGTLREPEMLSPLREGLEPRKGLGVNCSLAGTTLVLVPQSRD